MAKKAAKKKSAVKKYKLSAKDKKKKVSLNGRAIEVTNTTPPLVSPGSAGVSNGDTITWTNNTTSTVVLIFAHNNVFGSKSPKGFVAIIPAGLSVNSDAVANQPKWKKLKYLVWSEGEQNWVDGNSQPDIIIE